MGTALTDLLSDTPSLSVIRGRSEAISTGFDPLDTVLGGGLRLHDLAVIGGRPGVGKTIAALQWARTAALDGTKAIVVSYEHDVRTMLARLFALEVGLLDLGTTGGSSLSSDLTDILHQILNGHWGPNDPAGRHPLVRAARARIDTYADSIIFVEGSTKRTDLNMLERLVPHHSADRTLLVVDYLQKVPNLTTDLSPRDHMRMVAEGVKQLAIDNNAAVLAVAAAREAGLERRRVRIEHLLGVDSLGYESDVVLMVNQKWSIVSRKHIAFDPQNAEQFKKYIVFSVEKNRSGPDAVELEFEKAFSQFRFEPRGRFVSERLIDDGITVE